MYEYLNTGCRLLRNGWFLAFVLLALPNCGIDPRGECAKDPSKCPVQPQCPGPNCPINPCPGPMCPDNPCPGPNCPDNPCQGPNCPLVFDPGPMDQSDAIMCDIPAPTEKVECATQADIDNPDLVWSTQAAIALATSKSSKIALDWSEESKAACNGLPRKVTYLGGEFPDGARVCINCEQQLMIDMVYKTPAAACAAKCEDLVNQSGGFIPEKLKEYCQANALPATNYGSEICPAGYKGACTAAGNKDDIWIDPRRTPDKVTWIDLPPMGVEVDAANPNTLKRTAADSMPAEFDLGGASAQVITSGDAWLDFSTDANNPGGVILGVRASSCADPVNCPDNDYTRAGIVGLLLHENGLIYTENAGQQQTGPHGSHNPSERFRVRIVDNHDVSKTATISFYKVTCGPMPCDPILLDTSLVTLPYPLRVDSSFRKQNATLANVTLFFIKQ
jgi:hypothetical protein